MITHKQYNKLDTKAGKYD